MPSKKKKSKQDARGYGQPSNFRTTPTPKEPEEQESLSAMAAEATAAAATTTTTLISTGADPTAAAVTTNTAQTTPSMSTATIIAQPAATVASGSVPSTTTITTSTNTNTKALATTTTPLYEEQEGESQSQSQLQPLVVSKSFRRMVDELLDELQFTPSQVESLMIMSSSSLSSSSPWQRGALLEMEEALDWLCRHYCSSGKTAGSHADKDNRADPLPRRFQDDRVALLLEATTTTTTASKKNQKQSLTVVVAPPPLVLSKPSSTTQGDEDNIQNDKENATVACTTRTMQDDVDDGMDVNRAVYNDNHQTTTSSSGSESPETNITVTTQDYPPANEQGEAQKERERNKAWILQQYSGGESQKKAGGGDDDDITASAFVEEDEQLFSMDTTTGDQTNKHNKDNNLPRQPTAKEEDTNDEVDRNSNDQQLLQQAKDELRELEADASNEANNYLRSKHEIQQLQRRLKQQRQYVQGLQRRMENKKKSKQPPPPPPPAAAVELSVTAEPTQNDQDDKTNQDSSDDNDVVWDLAGGLFEAEDAEEGAKNQDQNQNSNQQQQRQRRHVWQCSVPPQWTGMTPQQLLEERCRKQKLPKPVYTQLRPPQDAFRGYQLAVVVVASPPPKKNNHKKSSSSSTNDGAQKSIWQVNQDDFDFDPAYYDNHNNKKSKNSSARNNPMKEFLALQALYEMDPTLPLHRLFPPGMARIWTMWQQQVRDAHAQQEQAVEAAKQERAEYYMSLWLQNNTSNSSSSSMMTTTTTTNSIRQGGAGLTTTHQSSNSGGGGGGGFAVSDSSTLQSNDFELNTQESWGDDDDQSATTTKPLERPPPSPLSSSSRGKQLQQEFARRQASAEYQEMLTQQRMVLPMWSFREQVLETIQNHAVTILCAETGAGKTTQCPQYVLEQAMCMDYGNTNIKILVTQPRRVAATSVAERVAQELCEPNNGQVGRLVGYQIRMESKYHPIHTKVLFCTTGVVLRRLQDDPSLQGITHVMVDEVHERQQQTDVLLIALRQLLATTRPDLKVVLMSATLDSDLFCSFFHGAPLIGVPGRTFPVTSYYLEDLMDATDHLIEEGSRYALRESRFQPRHQQQQQPFLVSTNRGQEKGKARIDLQFAVASNAEDSELVSDEFPGYKMTTRKSMDRVNEEIINFDLIEDVLELLLCRPAEQNSTLLGPGGTNLLADAKDGAILVFLPGLGEIRALTERLEGNRNFALGSLSPLEVIPMHSSLSSQDQRRAFVRRPKQQGRTLPRKVILSTNIAETSVTIPDVVCVIDAGRVREVRRNKRTSTSILVTDWCSKASAKQRAGRAGRVRPGLCLKLYSSRTAQNVMKASSEPELRRVPLEEVCLSILASGFAKSGCMDFLSQAPQPPTQESVQFAVDVLHAIGAIEIKEQKDTESPHFLKQGKRIEVLTPLGRHLARLPVDVRLGKMLIFGSLFRCTDKVLTIAAALSSQSIFSTFLGNNASVAKAKQRDFSDPDSDFLTLCNVWESYQQAVSNARFVSRVGQKFCQSNFLNYAALREIGDARRKYLDLLCNIGFVDVREVSREGGLFQDGSVCNENGSNIDLLHAVICAGLYPNVALLEQKRSTSSITLFHKDEQLYFHDSSVNAKKKQVQTGSWVVFYEKFGTPNRVSVSTTAFVHPLALLLFGGSTVVVKHLDRLVILDDWIRLPMGAQLGVILVDLRNQLDKMMERLIDENQQSGSRETDSLGTSTIQQIIKVLSL
ncbi:hypothetical protein ACA910_004312 [Epithemia clementina (nom. ined.)]